MNGVLNSWIWVKLVNGVREKMKGFVCKWCKGMEIMWMEIVGKNKVVDWYGVIVVVRERVGEGGKVREV